MYRDITFKKNFLLILRLLLVALGILCLINISPVVAEDAHSEEHLSKVVGATDFAAYYCAYKLYVLHENPYNATLLNYTCSRIVPGGLPFHLQFMYPPMLLPILAPVLSLGFKTSTAVWYISNLFFLLISGFLIWRSVNINNKVDPFLCAISALIFPPAFECLEWGQISIFVTLSIAFFFWGIANKKDIIAGFALVVMLLKVHLFLILAPFILWWLVKEKRIWILVSSFATLLFLYVLCESRVPGIHSYWLNSMASTSVHGEISRTASVSGMFRYLVGAGTSAHLFYIVPIVGIILSFLVWTYHKKSADFLSKISPILCISVAFAPYAWFHDYSILQVLQVGAVAEAFGRGIQLNKIIKFTLLPWVGIQLLTVVLSLTIFWSQHQLFWYPFALLLLWNMSLRANREAFSAN